MDISRLMEVVGKEGDDDLRDVVDKFKKSLVLILCSMAILILFMSIIILVIMLYGDVDILILLTICVLATAISSPMALYSVILLNRLGKEYVDVTKRRWAIWPLPVAFDTKIIKLLSVIISVEVFAVTFFIGIYAQKIFIILISFLILVAGSLFPFVGRTSNLFIARRVRMDVDRVADALTAELKAEKKSLYALGARSYVLKKDGVNIWIVKDAKGDHTVIRLYGIGDKNPVATTDIMNKIDNALSRT